MIRISISSETGGTGENGFVRNLLFPVFRIYVISDRHFICRVVQYQDVVEF
jgi:hypothetical protein